MRTQLGDQAPMVSVDNEVAALAPTLFERVDDVTWHKVEIPGKALKRDVAQTTDATPTSICADHVSGMHVFDTFWRLQCKVDTFLPVLELGNFVAEQDLTVFAPLVLGEDGICQLMLSKNQDFALPRLWSSVTLCDDLAVQFPPADV